MVTVEMLTIAKQLMNFQIMIKKGKVQNQQRLFNCCMLILNLMKLSPVTGSSAEQLHEIFGEMKPDNTTRKMYNIYIYIYIRADNKFVDDSSAESDHACSK